jgi:uncharacterized protein (TIGR02145 family)
MKNVQKKTSIISALLFISLLAACGEGESALVGKWVLESGGKAPSGFPDDLELFKDGTGICEGMSINWKVDKNRFIVASSSIGFALNYTVSDSTLTLTNDNSQSIKYENIIHFKKREQAAEEAAEKARAAAMGSMADERDGKEYKTVKIGEQVWMAENLNFNAEGSKCYENEPENCEKYGRLYNWITAIEACPQSWHLPSDAEWSELMKSVGGEEMAGKHLKAKSGWSEGGNGKDTYGFAALPGGARNGVGSYLNVGSGGYWWSTREEYYYLRAYFRHMYYNIENVRRDNDGKVLLFSVRCVYGAHNSEPSKAMEPPRKKAIKAMEPPRKKAGPR